MYKFQLYKNTGRGIYIGAIDAITKAYIRKNEVFADAFNYFMYDGVQVIQPECLKELDPTEIAILLNEKDTMDKKAVKAEVQQKYRDILKSAAIMEDGHTVFRKLESGLCAFGDRESDRCELCNAGKKYAV